MFVSSEHVPGKQIGVNVIVLGKDNAVGKTV